MPLEQEVARVVAGLRRLVATARSDLGHLQIRGTSRLDAVSDAAVLNEDRVRRQTNRRGKLRVDQHELGTDRVEVFEVGPDESKPGPPPLRVPGVTLTTDPDRVSHSSEPVWLPGSDSPDEREARELVPRYSSQLKTTDGVERFTGPWYTASTFVPSGSRT